MTRIILIAFCGALGALARYGLSEWGTKLLLRRGSDFPLTILIINVSGAGLLAFLLAMAAKERLSPEWSLALGVGFLGAFTTYSTFAVGADKMIGAGQWLQAALYIGGNLLGGWGAVTLGRALALKVMG